MSDIDVYIQSKSGDYNLEFSVERGSAKTLGQFRDFESVVKSILGAGGYFTVNRKGNKVFVPLHGIEYIEDMTPEEAVTE